MIKSFEKNFAKTLFIINKPIRKFLNHAISLEIMQSFIWENHYLDPRILFKLFRYFFNESFAKKSLFKILKNFSAQNIIYLKEFGKQKDFHDTDEKENDEESIYEEDDEDLVINEDDVIIDEENATILELITVQLIIVKI